MGLVAFKEITILKFCIGVAVCRLHLHGEVVFIARQTVFLWRHLGKGFDDHQLYSRARLPCKAQIGDQEVGQVFVDGDGCGIEVIKTRNAAKEQLAGAVFPGCVVAELIVLKTIRGIVLDRPEGQAVDLRQTAIGAHPDIPFIILGNGVDRVIRQTVFRSQLMEYRVRFEQVRAIDPVQAIAGAYPYPPLPVRIERQDIVVRQASRVLLCEQIDGLPAVLVEQDQTGIPVTEQQPVVFSARA